ncbi:hypothetical protein [Pyrobaculum calidifontis]|uniref:hypothetical protein n=1 Tax=Pyrobaculum calidifontis TaxID=181486 RepID=UPI0003253B1A|nr:hypothetical protein [Pyrobaculum calidifontis]
MSYVTLSFASSRGHPATRRFYNVATILRMSASFKLVNGSHLSLSTLTKLVSLKPRLSMHVPQKRWKKFS